MEQLTYVAGPLVGEEQLTGIVGELDAFGHSVFVGHVAGKLAEEEIDVLLTFAKRGHVDIDGGKTEIQVLTETSFADCLLEVDVGGGDDAHIDLLDLARTHADDFARLEDAQQLRLDGHGQVAHLVEEDCAAVGFLEISLAFAHGTGVCTLDVAEEFGVDGAFGQTATVDSDALLEATTRAVVEDLVEVVLACAVFARDEHGDVVGRCLDGSIKSPHQ